VAFHRRQISPSTPPLDDNHQRKLLAPARALHHHASERAFARTASGVQHAKRVHALEVRQLRSKLAALARSISSRPRGALRDPARGHTGRSKEKEQKTSGEFYRAHSGHGRGWWCTTGLRNQVSAYTYFSRLNIGVDEEKVTGAGLFVRPGANKEVATGGRAPPLPPSANRAPAFAGSPHPACRWDSARARPELLHGFDRRVAPLTAGLAAKRAVFGQRLLNFEMRSGAGTFCPAPAG